jgi:Cys-tRNA(Pro)/Cys-tRNA(Cys) deacylase
MSGKLTPAIALITRLGVKHTLHEYTHNPDASSYGLEAAVCLKVDSARVFKTLILKLDSNRLVVAVVPASTQVNLKAIASAFGVKKAEMAESAAAERSSGYVVGGISPLGQRKQLKTVIDQSILDYKTVLVSGGRRGLMLEVAPSDLIELCQATTADISR